MPRTSLDKNSPAKAGDTGSIVGPGRFHIPLVNYTHAAELLSPQTTAAEAWGPRAHTPSKRRHSNVEPMH